MTPNALYTAYLHSAAWRARRADALERAGYRCERCGWPWGLEVHHVEYKRLGRELDKDLVVLCAACHRTAHGLDDGNTPRPTNWATVVIQEDVI